jgi:hypothetical protein
MRGHAMVQELFHCLDGNLATNATIMMCGTPVTDMQ